MALGWGEGQHQLGARSGTLCRGAPSLPAALTFQPHELIVALLTQLQLPAVLAQELLVVAVDLLDGLADLAGGRTVLSGAGPPTRLTTLLPWAESLMRAVPCQLLPTAPVGTYGRQAHFTEE